jgi:hypothetical protein
MNWDKRPKKEQATSKVLMQQAVLSLIKGRQVSLPYGLMLGGKV